MGERPAPFPSPGETCMGLLVILNVTLNVLGWLATNVTSLSLRVRFTLTGYQCHQLVVTCTFYVDWLPMSPACRYVYVLRWLATNVTSLSLRVRSCWLATNVTSLSLRVRFTLTGYQCHQLVVTCTFYVDWLPMSPACRYVYVLRWLATNVTSLSLLVRSALAGYQCH